ncbi:MAG: hypothetical protein ACMG6S_29995, partial [Byssovorax sp.]
DGDEHVDRWDHDNELRRRFEDAERKKDEEATAAAAKKAADASKDEGDKDDGADATPGEASKRKQNEKKK